MGFITNISLYGFHKKINFDVILHQISSSVLTIHLKIPRKILDAGIEYVHNNRS